MILPVIVPPTLARGQKATQCSDALCCAPSLGPRKRCRGRCRCAHVFAFTFGCGVDRSVCVSSCYCRLPVSLYRRKEASRMILVLLVRIDVCRWCRNLMMLQNKKGLILYRRGGDRRAADLGPGHDASCSRILDPAQGWHCCSGSRPYLACTWRAKSKTVSTMLSTLWT